MYYYRHQAGGLLTAHPFTTKPTDAELDPLRAAMVEKFGTAHPKTGKQYWERIEQTTGELNEDGTPKIIAHGHTAAMSGDPAPITREQAAEAAASRLDMKGTGKGSVKNP